MKLYNILTSHEQPVVVPFGKSHWKLVEDYEVKLYTNEGTYTFKMLKGWITDFRSGSSLIDWFLPKRGNSMYTAIVLCHDMGFSGHLSKNLIDELLRQGMILSGQPKYKADLAYQAVQTFGNSCYYELDEKMPRPYSNNRQFEIFRIYA